MENRKSTLELKCLLTAQEELAYGREMAKEIRFAAEVEGRKALIDKQMKSEIEKHQTAAATLAEKIDSGFEYREVECEETPDYQWNVMRTMRTDTEEQVSERKLTDQERQMNLPTEAPFPLEHGAA